MAFDVAEETPERVLRMPPTDPRSAIGRPKWLGPILEAGIGRSRDGHARTQGLEGKAGKPRLPTTKPTIAR
jgi:hypothetical protein